MSNYNIYCFADTSTHKRVFEFTSCGPKGDVKKIVQFQPTSVNSLYNLAFGNLIEDGSIDDQTTNNNNDRNKILATIAAIVYEFTSTYPDNLVFFTGSTPNRTRLYRMAITLNYSELSTL